ncbi:MAG: hypothetical protein ABWW69_02200 [Pyrodictiaceae archaeon]
MHATSYIILMLLLATLTSPATIVTTTSPSFPPEGTSINITVSYYNVTLFIHPDGAIEPLVALNALVKTSSTREMTFNGNMVLSYESLLYENMSNRKMKLHVAVTMPGKILASTIPEETSIKKGVLLTSLEGMLSSTPVNKTMTLNIHGIISLVNETHNTTILVKKLIVSSKTGMLTLYLESTARGKPSLSGTSANKLREVLKAIEKLKTLGINFITFKQFSLVVKNNTLGAFIEASMDLEKATNYVIRKGMDPDEAYRAYDILSTFYNINGSFSLAVAANVSTNKLLLDTRYKAHYVGEVARLREDITTNMDVLEKYLLVLFLGLAEDLEKTTHTHAQPAAQPQSIATLIASSPMKAPKLIEKPPSKTRVSLNIQLNGTNINVTFRERGPRLIHYPSTKDPGRDAERTLIEISNEIKEGRKALSQLKIIAAFTGIKIHGLDELIPKRILLKPVTDNVTISKALISPEELETVVVKVEARHTQTPVSATTSSMYVTSVKPATSIQASTSTSSPLIQTSTSTTKTVVTTTVTSNTTSAKLMNRTSTIQTETSTQRVSTMTEIVIAGMAALMIVVALALVLRKR